MHFLSSSVVVALASLHLFPAVIAGPLASPDPAPAANGATAPRGLQLLNRGYDDDDEFHDFHLKDDDDHQVRESIERTFGIINEIPDEVLQKGDDETHKWLIKHGHRGGPKPSFTRRDIVLSSRLDSVQELATRGIFSKIRCAGAIAAFIASNAIAAAKILRIKRYIEALGGVGEAAELLLKTSNNYERLKEGGEALALLAGEILGVPLVAKNC